MTKILLLFSMIVLAVATPLEAAPLTEADAISSGNYATPGPCAAPAASLSVAHVSEREWHICAHAPGGGLLRYVITGERNPGPGDARYEGSGMVRLRQLDLIWNGQVWPLLLCGNCDLIDAVQLPGSTARDWTGGGYGLESSPLALSMRLDGAAVWLPVGGRLEGHEVQWLQAIVGYAPGEAIAAGSLRRPVLARDLVLAIDDSGYEFVADVSALADLELADRYHLRLEGVSTCAGGPWSGYRSASGATWSIPDCSQGEQNITTTPTIAPWIELTSNVLPWALRGTLVNGLGTVASSPAKVIFNRAWATGDMKLKAYGQPVSSAANPIAVPKGTRWRYAHRIDLVPRPLPGPSSSV